MFSVGASPFNSRARQLYGGWTQDQARGNLWGMYKANSMQARYGAPGKATDDAKAWMKEWRQAAKLNPKGTRAALRSAAGDWLKQRKRKPLSAEQKKAILDYWNAIPYEITPENAYSVSLASGATYPAWTRLMLNPELTYPMVEPDEDDMTRLAANNADILSTPDAYYADYAEYVDALRERLKEMRQKRGARNISANLARMINAVMPAQDKRGRAFTKFEIPA